MTRAFGVACVALTDSRAKEVPDLLRALFRLPGFRTKAPRMGKVVRISSAGTSFYSADDPSVRAVQAHFGPYYAAWAVLQ
jgi:hypothetical protein